MPATIRGNDGAVAQESTLASFNEAWTDVVFENGWVNHSPDGNSWSTAAYFKDALGIVHIRGLVKSGVDSSTIFTLPIGYRPAMSMHMPGLASDQLVKLQVYSSGGVNVNFLGQTSPAWVAIDNISFRAEQ